MATKLHEILAVEQTVQSAADKLLGETNQKFGQIAEFFAGFIRTLKRVTGSPEDEAIEAAARRSKELVTTVPDTLGYVFPYLAKALDVKHQKHLTNQVAKADLIFRGEVLMAGVPVDMLLDLEKRLPEIKGAILRAPTLDPSKKWERFGEYGWKTVEAIDSAQTEKRTEFVIAAPATDKHAAQVREVSKDFTVGKFSDVMFSGAVTSLAKAEALAILDDLVVAAKQARMRANSVEVVKPAESTKRLFDLLENALRKAEQ